MRRANIRAHVPFPLHGGFDLAHGGGGRARDVPETGGFLSDAEDEGMVCYVVNLSNFSCC